MPIGIHNPLPSSLASECKKCGRILASFIDPRQAFGPDKVIPPAVLANAKGLAIITVLKAGFLGSGRYGNGIAVARLADGTWSAPSAIGLGGAGFGGQIGFELTDFVFVLNDAAAVQAFSQQGSLTLGSNVSLAAGPIGRSAEAAGAASLKGMAGVFSYSKTKGLFAGVSLEGSAIVERRDANEKLYGQRYTASQLMEGSVRPPPAATSLMNVLNSRVFVGVAGGGDATYNDVPEYDDQPDDVVWEGRKRSGYGEGIRGNKGDSYARANDDNYQPKQANTWAGDIYDRPPQSGVGHGNSFRNSNCTSGFDGDSPTNDKAGPGRPTAPKPQFTTSKTSSLKENQALALFTFDPDQPGDLGFKKGDIITVIKKTDKAEDWWTGRIGTRQGIFPSNYVCPGLLVAGKTSRFSTPSQLSLAPSAAATYSPPLQGSMDGDRNDLLLQGRASTKIQHFSSPMFPQTSQTMPDMPQFFDGDVSDVDSVASESSVFSSASAASSYSSVASIIESLVDAATAMLARKLCTDNDLKPMYRDVLLKLSRNRFVRNLDRLLKRLFIDLRPELRSDEQRYAVRTLRASSVRNTVSADVYTTISFENESQKTEKSRKHLFSERLVSTGDGELIGSESGSDDDSDNGENVFESIREDKAPSVEELQKLIESLIDTKAFRIFKENFQKFVNSIPTNASATIKGALSSRDFSLLEYILLSRFDESAQGEFSWLHELDLLGYTRVEIAEMLFEESTDSPWIFFEPSSSISPEMKLGIHLPSCAHTVLQADGKSTTLPSLASFQFETMDSVNTNTAQDTEAILRRVSEFCGLAGIAPSSRDLSRWNGRVVFEHEKTTSRVMYGSSDETSTGRDLIICCVRALQGLSNALGYFQQVSCCCDSFTILKSLEHESAKTVQMVQIHFELVYQLHSALESLLSPNDTMDTKGFQGCTSIAAKVLFILGIPYSTETEGLMPKDSTLEDGGDMVHLFCLAVQALCLGFLTYSQAHCGALQPFFLDTAQRKVTLQGSMSDPGSSWQLQVQLVDLTCMGDMLEDSVLVFSAFKEDNRWLIPPTGYALDLLVSPQDLLDIWGPGYFVSLESEPGVFCAVSIRGGTIRAADSEDGRFHWSRDTVYNAGPQSRFNAKDMLLVGASVITKYDCPSDKHDLWENAGEEMSSLGTFKGYWENAERQAGFQGGAYISFVFQNVWAKVPETSLKDCQLEQGLLNYYFLQSKWGLQISCCTGVARRVSLCELLADVMLDFVESLFPIPALWEKLKRDHGIIQAFSGSNLQQWLGNLDEECQLLVLRITRYILSILRHTGIDHKGETLTVSWPQKENPFQCLKLNCDKQNYWTRLLADSVDCATFAYITPKCLETIHIKCRGLVPYWHGKSALLDTAVCRHITFKDPIENSPVAWTLKDKEAYCMGKLDSMLTIRVERTDPNAVPRLYVSRSLIPKPFIRRMFHSEKVRKPLKLQKLRERQWIGGQAESVVVLVRE